jgi:predicted AlkP superfamily pyrophosphatase or phosphodiesterase
MLPAAPKSLGRLSDVFKSASLATQGLTNPLALAKTAKAVVILVDGLGVDNLRFKPGHAPFLNRRASDSKSIDAVFPSTTASSITSLLTGLPVGEHGVVGYSVFDRAIGASLNMLTGWNASFEPTTYQPADSLAQMSIDLGVSAYSVGPAEYENSGFTQLNNRGSKYVPARSIAERFEAALVVLKRPEPAIVYLYIPELDQAAHAYGSESPQWLGKLEELDQETRIFIGSIDSKTSVVLTADHGIVNVYPEGQIFLDEIEAPEILHVGGDPRATFIYLKDFLARAELIGAYQHALGGHAYVCPQEELIDKGWFGASVSDRARSLMPDVFVLAKTKCAFYHRNFAKPQSLKMIGQHGSVSPAELKVPMLTWGNWA